MPDRCSLIAFRGLKDMSITLLIVAEKFPDGPLPIAFSKLLIIIIVPGVAAPSATVPKVPSAISHRSVESAYLKSWNNEMSEFFE